MFFQGTVTEGIAKAIEESRFVVCFVTDGEHESQQWEDDFLTDAPTSDLLAAHAVCLRIEATSHEEALLVQICPLPKKPTLVIFKDGDLKEYLYTGVSKQEFTTRIRKALTRTVWAAEPQSPPSPPSPVLPPSTQPVIPATMPPFPEPALDPAPANTPSPSSSTAASQATQPPAQAERIRKLLAERAARIDAERKQEAEETERRRAEKRAGKAKAKADAELAAKPKRPPPEGVDLHIRLLDGSTIRKHFGSNDTLRGAVRPWVDEVMRSGGRGGAAAYTFKMLRMPPPALAIDVTQEEKSLTDLGLWPSATLMLFQVAKATSALGPREERNVFMRFLGFILALISGMFGFVANFFSSLFGSSCPPAAPTEESVASASATGIDMQRAKGAQGVARDRKNDHQFYNGNSTNFEPRRDDEEEQ